MGVFQTWRSLRGRRLVADMVPWQQPQQDHRPGAHVVQFYGGPFPAKAVARFMREGLDDGEVGIVIATPEHTLRVQEELGGRGRCIFLDAEETLQKSMVHGQPDRLRFLDTVGDVVEQAADLGNGRVRAYGEMVVLLCKRGDPAAAHRMEELWNELGQRRALSLLCSYPLSAVEGRNRGHQAALRDAHSHAMPA